MPYSTPEAELWYQARKRARRDGTPFEITPADIVVPAECPVLGIPLFTADGRSGNRRHSPSLDRIDPRKGYVRGNVVVMSLQANRIKSNATCDEVMRVANWMREHVEC